MLSTILKDKIALLLIALYAGILLWWLKINLIGVGFDSEVYLFNWSYGFPPLIGALYGIFSIASHWGGYKSAIGRGLIFISLGLLGQVMGLQIWTYYNLIAGVEVPYPSMADLGYFALIPFYTLGALMFAKAVGGKFSLRTKHGQAMVFVIPLLMLLSAYFLFVRNIGFDVSDPIKAFLDYGYPLGEILPVSVALFILLISKKLSGGIMRNRILFLVFAFTFQFLTEYLFLYAVSSETYSNGGYNDILYATSYFIMSIGLISFKYFED